jgi:hypothetical protein
VFSGSKGACNAVSQRNLLNVWHRTDGVAGKIDNLLRAAQFFEPQWRRGPPGAPEPIIDEI